MKRILNNWNDLTGTADSVIQDWVRLFIDVPLASLWAAYEHFLRSDREFAPKPGQVLAKATTHAELIEMKRLAVEAALGNGARP